MENVKDNREFLKGGNWDKWEETETDQRKKYLCRIYKKGILRMQKRLI